MPKSLSFISERGQLDLQLFRTGGIYTQSRADTSGSDQLVRTKDLGLATYCANLEWLNNITMWVTE